jgi:hypothetical protein
MVKQNRGERAEKAHATISYRSAIVSFIDILGFRELVRTQSASDILRSLRLIQKIAAPAEESLLSKRDLGRDMNRTRAFAFSDSIVRIRPYDAEYNEGSFFHELISLVHMQAELADHGVFVRGGMSLGEIFFEENGVFGPALIRAYDLESQYANVPRIIIGPEVFQEFRKNRKLRAEHHNLADEIHYIKRLTRRGDDGLWFVDYLKAIANEMDEPAFQYPTFMERHRNFITERAKGLSLQGRELQKYLWLAEYHNIVCRECGSEVTELLITPKELPGMETLPEVSEFIRD